MTSKLKWQHLLIISFEDSFGNLFLYKPIIYQGVPEEGDIFLINRDIINASNYLSDNNYQKLRGDKMPITYNKLWKLLIDLDMTKAELKDATNVRSNVIVKMGKMSLSPLIRR